MKKYHLLFSIYLLTTTLLMNCSTEKRDQSRLAGFPEGFYKEGHRGTRGLMPENTIPSMKKAIEDGANFIEVDIQISQDKKVLIAHDAHINQKIFLLPNGEEIPEEDKHKYALFQMPYDSIRKFDVGSKEHPDFPQQKRMKSYIPLLGELIDSVEQFTKAKDYAPVIYNIEIKAQVDKDGVLQPPPAELIDLVMEVVRSKDIGNRFYIQSFDVRQIQEVHKRYPDVVTGFLTSKKDRTLEENLAEIGFIPDIYSPQYKLTTKELVDAVHAKGMKFVPWTVNTLEEMREVKAMGVDGIITDYPILFRELELE